MKKITGFAAFLIVAFFSLSAAAAETGRLPKEHWPHKGIFGTYDKAAVQRGFQVYKESCSACHAMKFMSYRNLQDLGYTAEEVKSVAGEFMVTDGPDDEGEMFERPGVPSDRFRSPFKNDNAARAANNGALPPDLSLIVKARAGGENYIFGLLTGYAAPPAGTELMAGMSYNKYFPGHQIAMPPPLMDGQIIYSDGGAATVNQAARDVTQFLAWAAEPHMEQRKQMGMKVFLFLLVFAGILLNVKRKTWS